MMSAPATRQVELEPDDTTKVDIYASYIARPPVKRAPGYSFMEPTQVLEDFQQVLFSLLGRQVTVSNPVAPNVKARRAVDIEGATVFLALVDDPYFSSSACVEELNRAVSSSGTVGTPHVFALDLQGTEARDPFGPFDSDHVALMAANRFPLASSSPDAPLREQEAEYWRNLQNAAKAIANALREPDSSVPASEEAHELASHPDVPIWLVQYRAAEARGVQARLEPGRKEDWRLGRLDPDTVAEQMEVGDLVAVWRTVERSDRGGIIAWGKVTSLDLLEKGRFELEITHAFPETPIGRDQLLDEMPGKPRNWPGQLSTKRLDDEERVVFARYLPMDAGDIEPAEDNVLSDKKQTETQFSSDRPETIRDLLRRGPLAFALAHKINDIWSAQKPKSGDKRAHERGAFILHIDAPWGGGKSTFANYVSRFLNPKAYHLKPCEHRNQPDTIFFGIDMGDDRKKGSPKHPAPDWPKEFRTRKWITVPFNAWQHQHVSPPWWDLYEVIRKHAARSLPIEDRPYFFLSEMAWRIFSKQVWWTLIALALVAAGVWGLLQIDTIAAWFATDENGKPLSNLPPIVTAITGTTGLVALIQASRAGFQKLVSSAGTTTDSATLGTSDPLRRFRAHFARMLAFTEQPVLVVIDDLDRCEPNYITELVRGMMTVFQSPHVVFLLLGDKGWIETAFAKVHSEMRDAHDEEDVGFGARFVEKAIQMSFVLPETNVTDRDQYVRHLLQPRRKAQDSKAVQGPEEEVRKALADAREIEMRTAGADSPEERREMVEKELKDVPLESRKAVADIYNSREAVKTAASQSAEEEIGHALEPLKSLLPANPRRIKRIINMITVYQASGQVAMGIDPGTDPWRQLVAWVVLMAEYPAHWRLLCADPDLLDEIDCPATDSANGEPKDEAREKMLAKFREKRISSLILGKPYREVIEEAEEEELDTAQLCALEKEWVEKFIRLIPLH